MNGALFVDESQNRIDFNGTLTVTREDLAALADYLFSNRAETNQRGELKLYVNGWRKQSRQGKNYISLQAQPPRNAFLGVASAQPQAQPAPAPQQAPGQPVWNPQTGQWVAPAPAQAPPGYGQGGSPGQPYAAPAAPAPQPTPAQVGAAIHAGAPPPVWQSPAPAGDILDQDDEIPF